MELLLWAGIALLQILVLPGWLLVRSLGLDRDGPIQTGLYAVGLGLLANHALVAALVLLGAYTRPVVLGVVAVECALACVLALRRRGSPTVDLRRSLIERLAREDGRSLLAWLLAATAVTGFLLSRIPVSLGSTFQFWDAIVSWNRWAIDWEAGRLPVHTLHYPQLLPTTWSLAYVLVGHPLQFVARGVMGVFPAMLALVWLDLWWRRDRREFLLAAVATPLLVAAAMGAHLGSGLSDVPVAAMTLLAFHPLAAVRFDPPARAHATRIAAAALLAVACASTKQAGLLAVLLLPVGVWIVTPRWPLRARGLAVAGTVAILLLGLAPWYGWAEWRIAQGFELDDATVLPERIFGDMPLLERARAAYALWEGALTPPGALAVGALALASLAHRRTRWITLAVVVPVSLYWALYLSYDLRNHAVALPFLGLSVAAGWEVLRRRAARLGRGARRALGGSAAAAALAWLLLWDPSAAILAAHHEQLLTRGRPALNHALLAYHAEHGFEGRILTDYRYLTSFPELREHYFVHRDAPADEFWTFRNGFEQVRRVLEDPDLDVRHVLVVGFLDEETGAYLEVLTRTNHLEYVPEVAGGRLYRVVRRPGGRSGRGASSGAQAR
ncbi:MAG: hypothetical protein ACQGVC_00310 [Myxococcota bacterium]